MTSGIRSVDLPSASTIAVSDTVVANVSGVTSKVPVSAFVSATGTARGSTLTISSGVITVTASYHYVDTQGAAALDSLDTINGGADGQKLTLSIANDARRVFLSASGNIEAGNFGTSGRLLYWADSSITLIYDSTKLKWIEVGFSGGRGHDGVKNVRDYGAVGDQNTDDTAAIQAAINDIDAGAAPPYSTFRTSGTIFFPAGDYKVTSALTTGDRGIQFLGEGGSEIHGTFNGYIFDLSGGFNYQCHSWENLHIENGSATNLTSGCIRLNGLISGLIKNCRLASTGGICVNQESAQDVTLDTCVLSGNGTASGSIGFQASNASVSLNSDYVACGVAIQHWNTGLNIIGGRFELNGTAILLGRDHNNTAQASGEVFISALSMESNDIHIDIRNGNQVSIQGTTWRSFLGSNTNGLWVRGGNNITVDACGGSGGYSDVNVRINGDQNGLVHNIIFRNAEFVNSGVDSWNVAEAVETVHWENTNYTPAFTNEYNVAYADTSVVPSVQDISSASATIASGAITVSANYMLIDTESAAATDDLDTISGAYRGASGSTLTLRPVSGSRTVVVKNGTGNIICSGDCVLDDLDDTITLLWDGRYVGGTWPTIVGRWVEVSRSSPGLQTAWVPASAMTPCVTNGAGTASREINSITIGVLAFDTTTSEAANFSVTFPKSWDAGTITFRPHWTTASSTGTVKWDLRGGSFADNVAINVTGLGTKVGVTDTLQNVDRVHNAGTSGAVTISNAAVDVPTYFEISRDVANDTLGSDAELLGIEIFYFARKVTDA